MNDFSKIAGLLEKYKILTAIFAIWIMSEMPAHWKSISSGNHLDADQAQHAALIVEDGQGTASREMQVSAGTSENVQNVGAPSRRDGEVEQEILRSPFQNRVVRQERTFLGPERARSAETFVGTSPTEPGALSLQAIAMRKGKNIAIINNRPLSVGDRHRGYEVIEINQDFVLLKNQDRTLRLSKD